MTVVLTISRKSSRAILEQFHISTSLGYQNVWEPTASQAGLRMIPELAGFVLLEEVDEIKKLRDEFLRLQKYVTENPPPELEAYQVNDLLERTEAIIALLDSVIADPDLYVSIG